MNINLDELGKKLHAKLDGNIAQIKAAKTYLEEIQEETESAIQTKLNAAKSALDTRKQEIAAIKTSIETYVDDRKAESKAAVAEWKANKDRKKLEKRAERAEKYAEACIEVTLFSAGEAEVAIMEAVAARKDADDEA